MSLEPLNDALDILGLDSNLVVVTAQTADGYGSFLARTSSRGHLSRAATMKVLAAACWCLVSPAQAPQAFAEASRLHERLGRSFATVAAICAGERPPPLETDPHKASAPDDLSYQALQLGWEFVSGGDGLDAPTGRLDEIAALTSGLEAYPSGHLEVPVNHYLDLVKDVAEIAQGVTSSWALARSLPRFLERGNEPVRMAMADRYHWQVIGTDIMPVEPELLAVGRIAHRALGDWDEDTLAELGIPDGLQRLPLRIARALEEPDGPRWTPDPRRPLLPHDGGLPTETGLPLRDSWAQDTDSNSG